MAKTTTTITKTITKTTTNINNKNKNFLIPQELVTKNTSSKPGQYTFCVSRNLPELVEGQISLQTMENRSPEWYYTTLRV